MALVVQTPLSAGVPLRASYLAQTVENANAIVPVLTDDWVDWSSSFTVGASTTAPSLGSSTKEAYYKAVGEGFVVVQFGLRVTVGGAWNAGSGTYQFALPFPAKSHGTLPYVGVAFINDAGAVFRVGAVLVSNGDSYATVYYDGSGGALGSSGPGTAWATGDSVLAEVLYKPA
jgi:hypothetical protein